MDTQNLLEIAKKYQTPFFLFDIDALQKRMCEIKKIVGNKIHICYAMKANPFLVKDMDSFVEKFEVCSPGELSICQELGINMDKVILSGVQKTREDILDAAKNNVGLYTAESLLHIKLLNEIAIEQETQFLVILRLTSGSQFGMSKTDLLSVIKKRNEYSGLKIIGLHYFVGTQRKKIEKQKAELEMLKKFIQQLQTEYNFTVKNLEYGPGLPVSYFTTDNFDDLFSPLKELLPNLQELSQLTELTVEMGRFFTAYCGYYVTQVMDTKSNCDQKRNEVTNYAIVDGGINHVNYLGQNMGMKIPIITHIKPYRKQTVASKNEEKAWMLCGSLCTTADILVRKIEMTDLAQNDILIFHNIGAYSITEGLNLFLSRKFPNVLLYNNKICTFARKDKQSYKINLLSGGEEK
ncbi:MAG: hypothetical protein BKP49_10580 [Treponema sp. CETP13]|nr:MAG: hypothetical protein BKP49_10580 [Treponema sp. CETP13]